MAHLHRLWSRISLVVAVALPGCLLLAKEPLRGQGEACEENDWCEEGLHCLKQYSGDLTGLCLPLVQCFTYEDCLALPRTHCENMDPYSGVIGACWDNECNADTECRAGYLCTDGLCLVDCTSDSLACIDLDGMLCRDRRCPVAGQCGRACMPY
jgi:hypothetical protein